MIIRMIIRTVISMIMTTINIKKYYLNIVILKWDF